MLRTNGQGGRDSAHEEGFEADRRAALYVLRAAAILLSLTEADRARTMVEVDLRGL
jgi:hypothetical protein